MGYVMMQYQKVDKKGHPHEIQQLYSRISKIFVILYGGCIAVEKN
jgi:hypothetical protein